MKRFLKISAIVLAVGITGTLAGCGGCSSCSGSTSNATVTNSNWFTGTTYKGIQPSFIMDDAHPEYKPESIVYDVTFDGASASNSTFSVEYEKGTYTTLFYAKYYDWQDSIEDFRPQEETKELVYYYETELNISGKYTFKKDGTTKAFEDKMVTKCYFRPAGKSLQPVYSEQEIQSTSPNKNKPKSLEDCYKEINVVYKNYYDRDCRNVITVTKEKEKEETRKTYSFKKVKNTLFDNASLYIAIRSMNFSPDYSQQVSLFSPAEGGVSSYQVSGSAIPLGAEERKTISAELEAAKLYFPEIETDENGEPKEDAGINSAAMNINYTGGVLIGTTQTVWYAAISNPDNNTARATMLKISIPLSYNLGTLNFTLSKVNSTLWNE